MCQVKDDQVHQKSLIGFNGEALPGGVPGPKGGRSRKSACLDCFGSLFTYAGCEGWLGQRMGVWIGCWFAASRADRSLYAAGVGWLQLAECAVIGPWHLGRSSVRDFLPGRRERRGGPSWPPGSDLSVWTSTNLTPDYIIHLKDSPPLQAPACFTSTWNSLSYCKATSSQAPALNQNLVWIVFLYF